MWAPASADWKADGEFIGGSDEDGGGRWQLSTNVPERWAMKRPSPGGEVSFWANNTPFRHLGFFPDMGGQFDWLASRIKPGDRVMNMFGYTGVGSLIAARAGAQVTHVDASKKSVAAASLKMSSQKNLKLKQSAKVKDHLKLFEKKMTQKFNLKSSMKKSQTSLNKHRSDNPKP